MSHSPAFIRTDRAIMLALIELLKEKSFEKITVQDILEKTPVTRATFYAHYRDKYEIAEKMLEQFLQVRKDIRTELLGTHPSKLRHIVRKTAETHRDATEALLKIRTEKVDLRQAIVDEFEKEYLAESDNIIEARIYAQARTELELSHLYNKSTFLSFEQSNEMFMNVTLKLLRLSDDKETRDFLRKKIAQKFHLED